MLGQFVKSYRNAGMAMPLCRKEFRTRQLVSTVVKNTESTARDQLANERTFLAWARTGLGFVGAGLGYFYATTENTERVKTIKNSNILPATGLLVGNGMLFLGFATYRYFATMKHLSDGKFPLNKYGVIFMIMSTGISTTASLYLIVHERLKRGDKEIAQEFKELFFPLDK